MIRVLPMVLSLSLASCAESPGGAPLPPLAQDQGRPGAALAEHLLAGYFAERATAAAVCVSMAPKAFDAPTEGLLAARFARLSALGRCGGSGTATIQIHDFACENPSICAAWATVPGHPSTRYHLRWQDGRWHFAADLRLIGQ